MSLEIFITLVVTITLAVIGWLVAHYLSLRQSRIEKQREYKTSFLVESYRNLVELSNDGINSFDDFKKLRAAITDVYLFGTPEQYKTISEIKTGNTDSVDLGNLIGNLKDQLRKDLGLPILSKHGYYFGITYNVPKISKLDMQSEGSKHLSSAYKTLLRIFSNGFSQPTDSGKLYEVLMDVWLYGTPEQAELALDIAQDPSDKIIRLLISGLHKTVRSDWRLEPSNIYGTKLNIANVSNIDETNSRISLDKDELPKSGNVVK